MLDLAIRKSEDAIGRVFSTLALASVAMLGLVWLSVAVAGWLAVVVPPPLAAAITGGSLFAAAAIAFFWNKSAQAVAKANKAAQGAVSPKTDDLISRATRIAERMAPGSPMAALTFALVAGIASVSLPPTLNPFLGKILDDVEKASDTHEDK
jgi:hypothetical protein